PHRRLRWPRSGEARRGCAADSRWRNLPGAGEGHHRRGGMGRALRRREARSAPGGEGLLCARLVGSRHADPPVHEPGKMERADAHLQINRPHGADMTNMWMVSKYDALNPPALKKLVSEGTQLRVFPQPVMEACLKASNEIYAEISATNADFKRI